MDTVQDLQVGTTTAHEEILEQAMAVLEDNEPARIALPGDADETLKNAPAAWYISYKTLDGS